MSQPAYVEGSIIGCAGRHPAGGAAVTGWNTYEHTGIWDQAGNWVTVDIYTNPNLQAITGIKSVFIQGILILTNNGTLTQDMHVAFRAPGETGFTSADYSLQAVQDGFGGVRQPAGLWVPVVDNKFQICWTGNLSAYHGAYYGAALSVNAYCK